MRRRNQTGHSECLGLTDFQYKCLSLLQHHLLLWMLHILCPVMKLCLTCDNFRANGSNVKKSMTPEIDQTFMDCQSWHYLIAGWKCSFNVDLTNAV